jgi:hypothetical protein
LFRDPEGDSADRATLPPFDPADSWAVEASLLRHIIVGWFVGEEDRIRDRLVRAAAFLDLARDREPEPGGDPLAARVEHDRACAVAHWLLGDSSLQEWRAASESSRKLVERDGAGTSAERLRLALLDAGWAGDGEAITAIRRAAAPLAARERDLAELAEMPPAERPCAAAEYLRLHAAASLDTFPGFEAASLFGLAFAANGLIEAPATAFAAAWLLVPGLELPPALRERGWSDSSQGRARMPSRVDFGRLEPLLRTLGLRRDPDSTAQPDLPEFASWTKQPGMELEADWHAPPGEAAWIETRGEGAGRAAALLAETFGGAVAGGDSAALADLLTVPPGANSPGNAQVRWEVLTALLRSPAETDRGTAEPLVAAGLRDPDWRVRMTAVWGVGSLRIGRLADAAGSAPLPQLGFDGLNAEDRRTLLALRDAARDRAAGRTPAPPDREGGGPGGAARAAFVARIGALFDRLAPPAADRHEALVMALLRMPAPGLDRIPRAWKTWAA